jgi:hypothetical protein
MATNNDAEAAWAPNLADPGNSMSMIGLYWLNMRWISGGGIKPAENSLRANLKVHYFSPKDNNRRYINIRAHKESPNNNAKTQVENGLWYVDTGPPRRRQDITSRKNFLEGSWERCDKPTIPAEVDKAERQFNPTDLDVYFWPTGSTITVCETIDKVKNLPVQWQIFSNYGAVDCLRKRVSGEVHLEELEGRRKEYAKRSKSWSTVEVVGDAETKCMTARHPGDVTTCAIFRWGGDNIGWQHDPQGSKAGRLQQSAEPIIYELYYHERAGNSVYREEGGALPDVSVWGRTSDNWSRVMLDLPGNITTAKTGNYVNSALGGNPDTQWVFQKCFNMQGIHGDYATGVEPPITDWPAVKLYVCRTGNGEIIDVSSILPSKTPET